MDKIIKLEPKDFPKALLEIPEPPKQLYVRGELPKENEYVFLSVIGSRKYSAYGKEVCEKLTEGLRGYPIIIVSGLAIGLDSIIHHAALKNGIKTLAIPGSGIDPSIIYPRINFNLSEDIVRNGGCLLSEFEPKQRAMLYTFPRRNRLVAGISKATLIIEAGERSGTLITARLALDYNRDVLAVPGRTTSETSFGTNSLIKRGAVVVTSSKDILQALGFKIEESFGDAKYNDCTINEKKILNALSEPRERDFLIENIDMEENELNRILSKMEVKELIQEEYGKFRRI